MKGRGDGFGASGGPAEPRRRHKWNDLATAIISLLALFLVSCGGSDAGDPTEAPALTTEPAEDPGLTTEPTEEIAAGPPDPFSIIDKQLQDGMQGSIAYTAPSSMLRGEVKELTLRISPSMTPGELKREISASEYFDPYWFDLRSAVVAITPLMEARLISSDPDAFEITELHSSPRQPLSTVESTDWTWSVLPKKGGKQRLILIISRSVALEAADPAILESLAAEGFWQEADVYQREEATHVAWGFSYWRPVQEYRDTIDVEVTFPMRVKDLGSGLWDAKFWLGPIFIVLTGVAVAFINNLIKERREAKAKQERKPDFHDIFY